MGAIAGDDEAFTHAALALSRITGEGLREAAALMVGDTPERRETIGLLAGSLSGSISALGYPVGLGLTISEWDAKAAAAKIVDRLVLLMAATAFEAAEATHKGAPTDGSTVPGMNT